MSGDELVSIWMRPERVERSGPGRRPGFSRAQIVQQAITIADAEGLEAATMRRIADALGTGAMSLYRYVPKRDDLIDLMLDEVMAEMDLPPCPSGDWRADLTLVSHQTRAVGLRHPWQVALAARRPNLGPNSLRVYEFTLSVLDGFGLSIDEIAGLAEMLTDYVNSAVHREVAWLNEARRTGMDMRQWMIAYGPYARSLIESGEYPMFTRSVVEARVPHLSPEERFQYGLDRVLNAIAAALP
ncbi:TetR/AcrR family transcriptional regulator C-terminal domain-containing protein [Acrocarpospora macrocephala]|uniref:TetR family transcriptional regulator n=1 Tax=Acrocarpospora macrocephala TaxID=150177 RepID=A0A5M3WMY6_9ACTN|nr:TetR/AcrR family transcriptional regulator [Acrocarpospora macrocephala]GES08541.1 TetR family transcriptional regulator [Acrocarpospora macrocephala]